MLVSSLFLISGRRPASTEIPITAGYSPLNSWCFPPRAYTSCDWWHANVVPRGELLLFPRGKTKFHRPDGTIGKAPGHGVVLIGMGETACTALRRSGLGWCASNQARIA